MIGITWLLNIIIGLAPLVCLLGAPVKADRGPWRLVGDFSESCSCSVPCACNFGESPSPYSYCYVLAAWTITRGSSGDTDLSGLRLAMSQGEKGAVFFVDEQADQKQGDALRAIVEAVWRKVLKANHFKPSKVPLGFRLLGIKRAKIEQIMSEKGVRVKIGDFGSFEAAYIMGLDGKSPVIVENNATWNVQHDIKAKASRMAYRDGYGNHFAYKGNNANQAKFDWTDATPTYFR